MHFHGPPSPNAFHNFDPGTTEIWLGTSLIGLVAVSPGADEQYFERWALFHGGALDDAGKALGSYPAKDLPPEYHASSPFTGPIYARKPAQQAPWTDLHGYNGSLASFKARALWAVTEVYSTPVGAGVAAAADWVSGDWQLETLDNTLKNQLTSAETGSINRWFEGRRGGQQIALTYAEHRSGSNTRRVHQISKPIGNSGNVGMAIDGGDITLVFAGQGGTHTLSAFLNLAKQYQNVSGWSFTTGSCTWYD